MSEVNIYNSDKFIIFINSLKRKKKYITGHKQYIHTHTHTHFVLLTSEELRVKSSADTKI